RHPRHLEAAAQALDLGERAGDLARFQQLAMLGHVQRVPGERVHPARGQADDRVAAEALAAVHRLEQVGVRAVGQLQVDGQRRVEVGGHLAHDRQQLDGTQAGLPRGRQAGIIARRGQFRPRITFLSPGTCKMQTLQGRARRQDASTFTPRPAPGECAGLFLRPLLAQPRAAATAARISAITAAQSGWPKMALPATKVSAPAAAIAPMLSGLTPPSISSRIGLPMRSIISRTRRSLSRVEGMNSWPPNPGLTDISSTWSRSSSTHSSASTGVAGFSTSPARHPCPRISWMVRCTWRLASGWKLISVAPAAAKSGTIRSTGSTIRWTSIGAVIPCLRS